MRRLRFTDMLVEESAQAGGDDAAALFDADFALMVLELRALIARLGEVFGTPEPAAGRA